MARTSDKEIKLLAGAQVNYVRFSHQVDINFVYGKNNNWKYANLQIEADFQLEVPGNAFIVKPDMPKTLAPVIELLHTKVTKIVVSENYELAVSFDNNASLLVKPTKKLEAWNLTGDGLPYYVAQGN